ncbi:MAG TPA: metallophosphoesterase [Dehalococcoidia bacterium]|nr:metallophosphoesterase [Dehalococcoidia bacterium]
MRIGVMSDTHDRLDAIKAAIDFFNRQGVRDVLHAGDLVSPLVVPKFSTLKAKLHYTWGNNEGDREFIRVKFGEIGVVPLGDFAALELSGRKIALLHGTHEPIVDSLVRSGLYDIVVRGHSHRAEIIKGRTLLVNPGEVCGYLSGHQTVALIDLDEMHAEILKL